MKKKILACIMLASLGVGLLTGCQQGTVTDGTEGAEVTVQGEEGAQTLEGGDVNLKVWCSEEDLAMVQEMCNAFAQQHQGTANLTFTLEPMQEGESVKTMLKDIDNAPDVYAFTDSPASLVAAGAISPVPNAEEIAAMNAAGAVETATVNEVLYAYPMTADNGYYLYYDKSVLSEADVATMDALLAKAAESGKKVTFDMSSGWYLYSFFSQTGMTAVLSDDGLSNICDWNTTEGAIKGVDVANALWDITGNAGFLNAGDTGLVEGATNGTVCAGVSGVWLANSLQEAWGSNLAATKLPTYTCAGGQVQMGSFAGYKMVGVNAYSKHTGWGHLLAAWLTNEENQMKRFQLRGLGPSNNNAAASPEVQKSVALQGLMAQAPYADLQNIGANYWTPVSEFGLMMADHNLGGKDMQIVLDEMVQKITAANGQ